MNMESARIGAAAAISAPGLQELFRKRLLEIDGEMESLTQEFRNAHSFPSIAIDNFLPPAMADVPVDEFPKPTSPIWREDQKCKSSTIDARQTTPGLRSPIYELNSVTFLSIAVPEAFARLAKGFLPTYVAAFRATMKNCIPEILRTNLLIQIFKME